MRQKKHFLFLLFAQEVFSFWSKYLHMKGDALGFGDVSGIVLASRNATPHFASDFITKY